MIHFVVCCTTVAEQKLIAKLSKTVKSKIPTKKLKRQDWVESELNNLFLNCNTFFRLPCTIQKFIQIRLTEDNPFLLKKQKKTKIPRGIFIKSNAIRIHKPASSSSEETNFGLNQDNNISSNSKSLFILNSTRHSIETLKKLGYVEKDLFIPDVIENQNSIVLERLAKHVIKSLLMLEPKFSNDKFNLLSVEQIYQLCIGARDIVREEKNIVNIQAPSKVFGDIHGHLKEILVLLRQFGTPNHYTGDVELVSYVFNGDFVDRGPHSLEVICLLFSLKVLYPEQVYLIRGNHEDSSINCNIGFKSECERRLPENYGEPIWELFNNVFNFLPVGGVIANKIFVVHGGIGPSFNYISEIENINKPIINPSEYPIIRDILWSDPTESDTEGAHPSARGHGISKYDKQQVLKFCENNNIELIIRSHQCVPRGYEFFSGGHLITVFSAGNYCGNNDNDGALLTISTNLTIRAKSVSTETISNFIFTSCP